MGLVRAYPFHLLVLALLLFSCQRGVELDLGPRLDLPQVVPLRQESTLVVAVANMLSPGRAEPYEVLAQHLAQAAGLEAVVVQRRSYQAVLDLLARGEADVGFLCTLAAGKGLEEGFVELLAASEPEEGAPYRALVVVPASSRARSFWDLEGQRFALVDPLSNTGAAWPRLLLGAKGRTLEGFFRQVIYTYAHDRSLKAVQEGFVDGAAVDSLVYRSLAKKDPSLRRRLRVVWASPPDPPPPVVVRKGLEPRIKARLRAALLAPAQGPVREALEAMSLRGFGPAKKEAYLRVYRRAQP